MGTLRGAAATVVGGDVQGGSSITQQYVKNVLVQQCEQLTGKDAADTEKKIAACYQDAAGVTPQRKLQEMRYAIAVNKKYSKEQILTGYLNLVGLGGRVYGAEAGAEYYFGVHAKDLSLVQSATLVAILNNPSNLRIDQPSNADNGAKNGYAATKERRDYVLQRMYVHHDITKAQRDEAKASPITPKITATANGCSSAASGYDAGYFCDYVRDQVLQDPAFGKTAAERIATLDTKGLEIHTSLDLDLQAQAQSALSTYVPTTMTGVDVGGSNVTVEPGTGRILSMVQNTSYTQGDSGAAGSTAVNYSADSGYGNSGGFQTGSTYKVFTLAEWLATGHTLSQSVSTTEHTFQNSEFTNSCQNVSGGTWSVANAESVPVDDRAGRDLGVDQHGLRADGQAARPVQDRPARPVHGHPPGVRRRPDPDPVVDPGRERPVADRPGRGLRRVRERRRGLHPDRDRFGDRVRRHEDHPVARLLQAGCLGRRRGHRRLRAAGRPHRRGHCRQRQPGRRHPEVREDRHDRR
ncbi:transglycosylase domain-containing protein [Curtobacterium flaccumfaciens]|nr:transglycosylase domain-containing protein [Curtobacterium flaccumfaciens]